PGSYMIRDFARNITSIEAFDDNGAMPLVKRDKQTWCGETPKGGLRVVYRVYAYDLSVRSAYLDTFRAFFNGTSLFFRISGLEEAPWQLVISRPQFVDAARWQLATSMPQLDVDAEGFGVYAGVGYDALTDFPVEISAFEEFTFDVRGIDHRFVLSEAGPVDMGRLSRDLAPICREHASLFGDLPVDRYVFLTLATADGYGGLEHRDSTSLICQREDLPRPGLGRPDKGYRRFLGLCSHEYFHLWNVKRIRPERLAGAQLDVEVHTELLWAFEGITSYYDELALSRCGILRPEEYLGMLAESVTRVLRSPGRGRQSIAESSFDAWTRFYKQDENAPNAIVSYYTKGACVALGLDVTMRQRTRDTLCLDDLMRHLWQRFGSVDVGVRERGIEHELSELTGTVFDDFFASYVYGVEELPFGDWFAAMGIGFRLRAARDSDDLGGYEEQPTSNGPMPSLGANHVGEDGGLRLTQVITGGAAQAAGLSPGDVLVAIESERVNSANLKRLLLRASDEVEVHYFRRGRLYATTVQIVDAPQDTCELWLLPDDTLAAPLLARRRAWLASSQRIESGYSA
ncbi:MAG: M61 family metallopeptidase, partial [Gammaproteobacteria bacterium]|nr:M61 family metallopeptidase [Gammaproteobacteria bacterium]